MNQISTLKRATQGVKLINLKDEQRVATVAKVASVEEDSVSDEENLNEKEEEA